MKLIVVVIINHQIPKLLQGNSVSITKQIRTVFATLAIKFIESSLLN